jgi:hypothetical protein
MEFSVFPIYPAHRSGTPYVHSIALYPLQSHHASDQDVAKPCQFQVFSVDEWLVSANRSIPTQRHVRMTRDVKGRGLALILAGSLSTIHERCPAASYLAGIRPGDSEKVGRSGDERFMPAPIEHPVS